MLYLSVRERERERKREREKARAGERARDSVIGEKGRPFSLWTQEPLQKKRKGHGLRVEVWGVGLRVKGTYMAELL